MTLEGVAIAFGRKLEMNEEALEMLKDRYAEFSKMGRVKDSNLTEYRLKMARLPQGARPIRNPVGTAPGVLIHEDSTTIFVLPGVPQEMEAIFEGSIIHLLRDKSDGLFYTERSLQVFGIVESSLAALIDQVMLEYPAIYIKSHPIGSEPEVHIELHLTTNSRNKEGSEEEIRGAMEKIQVLISQKGGRTSSI
jgi:molybdopterin-biosynthesis enzyme MoeA-like protein